MASLPIVICPAVGKPGYADASYTSYLPPASKRVVPLAYRTADKATVTIIPGTWDQTPTLYNVIQKLATLELGNVLEISEWSDCAGDLRSIQRLD